MSESGTIEATPPILHLIEDVEEGETITITHGGKPIATITKVRERRRTVEEAIEAMIAFGDQHTLGDISLRETIEEGRRY